MPRIGYYRAGSSASPGIMTVGVLEYRPTPGYACSDRFTATLMPEGGTYFVKVAVRP